MHFLTPHSKNSGEYSPIRFDCKVQSDKVIVNFFISLDSIHTLMSFSMDGFANNGLWDFDVAEVFLTRSKSKIPYLELQVSPLNQKFALLIERPREITKEYAPKRSQISGSYDRGEFRACFEVDLNEIPGDGNEVFGNFFCCLGKKEERCFFAFNINQEEVPDFHRPDLFKKMGEIK